MADIPIVASNNANNETQTTPTTEEMTTSPVSPTPVTPEPLFYVTGEARVIRRHGRNTISFRNNPYMNSLGNSSTRARRQPQTRRWDWLPTILNTWRSEEEMPLPADSMDTSPYTQEPIHHTVPVLTARLYRHEQRLESLERDQHVAEMYWMRQIEVRIAQLRQSHEDMNSTMEMIHQHVIDDRGAVDLLQTRLEECEQRSHEAEQHARMLEQRLTIAEENARQAGRLAVSVDHLITLLPQLNLHQD